MTDASIIYGGAEGKMRIGGYAESAESRAEYGLVYEAVLFYDFPVEQALRIRGPRLAHREPYRRVSNPFVDRSRPFAVMLDPGLDLSDEPVGHVLELASQKEVVEFRCLSACRDSVPKEVGRVEIEQVSPSHGLLRWSARVNNSSALVAVQENAVPFLAERFFDLSDRERGLEAVLAAEAGKAVGCDVLLTSNEHLLAQRNEATGWGSTIAPVDSLELARMLGILFRRRGVLPTSSHSVIIGGVYEATVFDWLPSYLRLYRALIDRSKTDRALDYLDGLLSNCVLAVMALDRLAVLHFAEDTERANNSTVGEQRYESTSLLVAVFAALESVAWLMVTLAKATPRDRRDVGYRRLLKGEAPWARQVGDYCPSAVSALKTGAVPSLGLARHFRDLLEHYIPVPVAVGIFGEKSLLPVKFLERLHIGLLRAEAHGGETPCWPEDSDRLGIIGGAVVPYPFFRVVLHDLLGVVECVLHELCASCGAPDHVPANPHYSLNARNQGELPRLLSRTF
jgi:hypothetical protein